MPTPLPPASNATLNPRLVMTAMLISVSGASSTHHCYFTNDGPKVGVFSDSGARAIAELDVEGLGPVFQWEIVVAACFGIGHRYVGSAVDDAWRW